MLNGADYFDNLKDDIVLMCVENDVVGERIPICVTMVFYQGFSSVSKKKENMK